MMPKTMPGSRWPMLGLTCALLLGVTEPLYAGQTNRSLPVVSNPDSGEGARHTLIAALVDRWGPHVRQASPADEMTWRERLSAWATRADLANLKAAVQRETFDEAMAALAGRGGQTAGRLGDLGADLTYTPIPPCRIADTRSIGGPIAAAGSRSFAALNVGSFASQGGNPAGCGTLGVIATAVAVSVTAVAPAAAGYSTVYSFGTSQPATASLNYGVGSIVTNAIIVSIPNPLAASDFTIYSYAQSDYVVDLVGYFAPNVATALECIDGSSGTLTTSLAAYVNVSAPSCPAGYTSTGLNCDSDSSDVRLLKSANGTCAMENVLPTPATFTAWRTCCRVPGR